MPPSRRLKRKQPLAEVFGFPVEDQSEEAERHRRGRLCPYNNKVPNCTKDKRTRPLGVCSLYHHGDQPTVVCPVRFRQDWLIASHAADFFFPPRAQWTSLQEVRLDDANGKSAGNIVGRHAGRIEFSRVSPPSSCRPVIFPDGTPCPWLAAPLDPVPPAEDSATGGCRPGGPYCPGLNAALDAAAKGGLAAGSLLKIGSATEPREVIIHRGVINGERRQLLLQFCPFCRAELEPRRTLVAAAPTAEGTLLAGASPAPDGQAVQAGEAEEAQGGAPAKVSPRDIWRAPTLVNWCLLGGDSSEDPEEAARADAARDKAEADLDAAFAKTSAWLRAQLQAGRRDALDEAFDDHLGPVMLAHIRSGAMDTEPCANVRLALREVAGQCQAQLDQTAEES